MTNEEMKLNLTKMGFAILRESNDCFYVSVPKEHLEKDGLVRDTRIDKDHFFNDHCVLTTRTVCIKQTAAFYK